MTTVKGDLGDGPRCAEDPAHGKTVTMTPSGRLWCPVSQALFGPAKFSEEANGFVPGALIREGYRTTAHHEPLRKPPGAVFVDGRVDIQFGKQPERLRGDE